MTDYCETEASGLLSVKDALIKISDSIAPVSGGETVTLMSALGRITHETIRSPMDIPPFRNSSMDGYAFFSGDINNNAPASLTLSGTSWAGNPYRDPLLPGHCIRIFTGAIVPEGADSVALQEQVKTKEGKILLPAEVKPHQNIRNPGDDIQQGSILLKPAKKLTSIDLGLLASSGIYSLSVKRKLKIAFFSTGDELISIGNTLKPGQIHDSNRYTLKGLLENRAYDISDLGVIPDDKQRLKNRLIEAAGNHDAIITTGGASVGEADYIKEILDDIGEVNFWKIAMKPGKPLAFGSIGECTFFGLPGNPVSVIATYHQIVSPALRKLSGEESKRTLRLHASCTSPLKKSAGRQEYQRGILKQLDNGQFSVESAGKQGSHILSAISRANCYIILPAECSGVRPGERVEVEPFSTLL